MAFANSVHARAGELIKLTIEMTTATGSLGQGLSIAAGLALAVRLDGSQKRIFCLIGDGKSREWQIWEAVDFLAQYHLTEVCPIFNCNSHGQSDPVSPQQEPEVTAAKLRAVGFEVRVIDGHDPEAIRQALEEHTAHTGRVEAKPFAIVARTVKGWGFTGVLGEEAHGKAVPEKDRDRAMAAVDAKAREVKAAWTEGELRCPPLPTTRLPAIPRDAVHAPPSFREALKHVGLVSVERFSGWRRPWA